MNLPLRTRVLIWILVHTGVMDLIAMQAIYHSEKLFAELFETAAWNEQSTPANKEEMI